MYNELTENDIKKLHVWIQLLEAPDEFWHPAAGDAGDGAHADDPGFQSLDFIGLFQHGLIL